MAPVKIFISHDVRDSEIAGLLGKALGRITLGQIEAWYSSDGSALGGLSPGSVWLDGIRKRLQESRALIALLTPRSVSKPWLLFEAGFAAANQSCEVIPVAIGIDSLAAVPFPLAMYQAFQIADYESLKRFAGKLLAQYEIPFDEELVKPVLQSAVGDFTRFSFPQGGGADSPVSQNEDIIEAIKQHIDRALLRFAEGPASRGVQELAEEVYSVAIDIPLRGKSERQYITIGSEASVQDILDRVYYMIPEMPPFRYLDRWLLRERVADIRLVVREVGSRIPASAVFRPGSEWEVVLLKAPYRPADSGDAARWYGK